MLKNLRETLKSASLKSYDTFLKNKYKKKKYILNKMLLGVSQIRINQTNFRLWLEVFGYFSDCKKIFFDTHIFPKGAF